MATVARVLAAKKLKCDPLYAACVSESTEYVGHVSFEVIAKQQEERKEGTARAAQGRTTTVLRSTAGGWEELRHVVIREGYAIVDIDHFCTFVPAHDMSTSRYHCPFACLLSINPLLSLCPCVPHFSVSPSLSVSRSLCLSIPPSLSIRVLQSFSLDLI